MMYEARISKAPIGRSRTRRGVVIVVEAATEQEARWLLARDAGHHYQPDKGDTIVTFGKVGFVYIARSI